MKSIMISIRPEWVEKILNKEKTIEIRKTMPSCELPCKVYIYCTMPKKQEIRKPHSWKTIWLKSVVAEFTLDAVGEFYVFKNGSIQGWNWYGLERSCLTYKQISEYIGLDKKGYAWHIDNLKIYDKPKELSEFRKDLDCDDYPCNKNCDCKYNYYDYSEGCWACGIDFDGANCIYKQIKRPPQSWFYVEKVGDEK